MDNGCLKLLAKRRSIRKYKNKPISDETIREILEFVRQTPSAINRQPWLIGVVKDQKLREKIADITDYGKFIKDAPVCFVVFCERESTFFLEDGSALTMNIITACQLHGIGTCWVAGHKKFYMETIRKLLKVPENYVLISLISAGYSAEEPNVEKKPLSEIVFFDTYTSNEGLENE